MYEKFASASANSASANLQLAFFSKRFVILMTDEFYSHQHNINTKPANLIPKIDGFAHSTSLQN